MMGDTFQFKGQTYYRSGWINGPFGRVRRISPEPFPSHCPACSQPIAASPPVAVHETPVGETQADGLEVGDGLAVTDLAAIAWVETETADLIWTRKVVAANPEYVINNGKEKFTALVRADQAQSALAAMRGEVERLTKIAQSDEWGAAYFALLAQQTAAEAQVKRLTDALEWYSKATVSSVHPDNPGWCDDGRFARAALSTKTEGGE